MTLQIIQNYEVENQQAETVSFLISLVDHSLAMC